MDKLIKLINYHSPIGLYNITEGSNIYRELSVYAEELERLEEEVYEVQRESFVSSAKTWGLSSLEQLFGSVRDELDTDFRRSMLTSRFSLQNKDFTPEALEKILQIAGISGKAEEYPRLFRLTVEVFGSYSLAKRKWITSQLRALLPAHLEVDPIFEGFSFSDSDSLGKTFREMEAKAMTWAQIDIYC